jgi:putative Ca2+/H+ antiporter (TMEM165/GDT1 family)
VPRSASRLTPNGIPVEAFLISTMVVGLAEIGDKTQIATIGELPEALQCSEASRTGVAYSISRAAA